MTRPIRFAPAAQHELNEAAEFYDAEDAGLGGAVAADVIIVLAVAHQHRRPGYWRNRE